MLTGGKNDMVNSFRGAYNNNVYNIIQIQPRAFIQGDPFMIGEPAMNPLAILNHRFNKRITF